MKTKRLRIRIAWAAAICAHLILLSTSALSQAPFYQGKTLTLITGSTAGSQYDAHARLIAQHWGRHIPGNPGVIVQNMPGAGSLISANHLYNVAKPDGLTITSIIPGIYFSQLAGSKEVQFDYAKFNWIGSIDRSDNVMYMRSDTPFKTIDDVRRGRTGAQVHGDGNRHGGPFHAQTPQ